MLSVDIKYSMCDLIVTLFIVRVAQSCGILHTT